MPETFKLDARGLFCPEPVMMLHKQFRSMRDGDILEVVASDPSTVRDIPKFCRFLNHELLKQSEVDGEYFYTLQKCPEQ